VNVVTILARNEAIEAPVSWLFILMGWPFRGSISVKETGASNADKIQTTTRRIKNSAAGSGNLFPTRSIVFKARSIERVFTNASFLSRLLELTIEFLHP
jgi:hypothetical protein